MPATPSFDARRALDLARATLDIEARALDALKERQGDAFVAALGAILACRGRVVVMGMGKSGHVGRKVAATLASTGTPALFVHPGEASHGDLGMVTNGDVVLAISNSGESDEIAAIVPAIKRLGVTLIAMTGNVDSSLGRHADIVLSSAVDQEACPLNLAPTASTTAQMALGDAIAVALLDARGFREEDFARSHPGGSLGRKLLMLARIGWQTLPEATGGYAGAARYPALAGTEPWLPDVERVLLSSEPFAFGATHIAEARALCPAARVQRVDGELLGWYGVRAVAGLRYLRTLADDNDAPPSAP